MASDEAQTLIARLRAARESWVPLTDGKRIKLRRPAEAEFAAFMRAAPGGGRSIAVELEHVQRHAVDWDGITEADLLGATVGSTDPLPFDAGVWAEAVADRADWMQAAAQGLLGVITQHLQAKADASGNSPATSTPGPLPGVAATMPPAASTTPTTPSA